MKSDITEIMCALISLFFALVSAFLIPWLRQKLGSERFMRAAQWARIAVEAAEQIYSGPGRGQEKKEYVIRLLEKRGIGLKADVLEALIESEVGKLRGADGVL